MDDDSRVIDKGWDALPEYGNSSGDADDAVTVSISTTPGEWLVNTVDAVVVPMSMAEVVEALQQHKLTERSLVWRAGMPEWAPVDKVPQLKLAARMPLSATSATPPRPTPAAGKAPATAAPSVVPTASVVPTTASKPPPKPVRSPSAQPASAPPPSIPSRKATLPFGLPTPLAPQSRPSNPRASAARLAVPPEASNDEPEVLAVYARPAATISFDLAPVEPRRTTSTAPPTPPQTLAPTTTDSAQRRGPMPRNADLSVVAASDFRQVQRSSKRLVWISSLASAAAASLLTFALARGGAPTPPEAGKALAAAQPVAAPVLSAAPVVSPPAPSPEPASAAPEPPAPASEPVAAAPKPKASPRKARAASAPAARPAQPKADPGAATRDPASEPNPYDVKLDEEPAAPAKPAPPAAHGSGLEADSDAPQASSSGSTSPGF